MNESILDALAKAYGLKTGQIRIKRFGSGHIHKTYRVDVDANAFILQEFNDAVFTHPERISGNLEYLMGQFDPSDLPFVLPLPIPNKGGAFFTHLAEGLYRLFPFVSGVTQDAIVQKGHAKIASEAFARFIQIFLQADAGRMEDTIAHFHNLEIRYQQFDAALKNPRVQKDSETEKMVDFYLERKDLLEKYGQFRKQLPLRVTHNDTKINNLIFAENLDRVNALIDLDTIMAGFVFYDFGDLVRTVACTRDESSLEWDQIQVDMEKYEGLLEGFYSILGGKIQDEELDSLPFGGEMMTLIMGVRFLTDHLNGNIYYQVDYQEQNLHRAKNQAALLSALIEKREDISELEGKLRKALIR
ncbi:phosphotransferase enzyme family protein [Cyclobacterium jeungdonense]|uniref:Aminoglycoside phosphotransferase family protein n=1 Tax=Cyclobacterium jeungdonense TaxID=708087 RepID=A0ABT8C4Q1_9BACT|nr:aminoglycoside phosphotransferase family protein [Cyclobacterium jeungdonense]MDN3687714.1 aminoglycoside phosphotransferase family protein [Cyclobacterium jeungdonense]